MNGTYARDPEVLQLLEKFRPEVQKLTQEEIGVTRVLLDNSECRAVECNMGNMITDSFINARVLSYKGEYWTDAAIALIQGGGIRASVQAGKITRFDLDQILPWNDRLILVRMPGAVLRSALEHSVARYTKDRGEFLQMSGIRVVYNLTSPVGHRVESVQVRCAECNVPHYNDLDDKKIYGVVTIMFMYDGGDGYTMFKVCCFGFI